MLLRWVHNAATRIQALARGRNGRAVAAAARLAGKNNAAVELQRVWKGGSLRTSGVASSRRQRAALRIQTQWRGHSTRRWTSLLLAVARAATKIQSRVRGILARRHVRRLRANALF